MSVNESALPEDERKEHAKPPDLFDELACERISVEAQHSEFELPKVDPYSFSSDFKEISGGRFSWVYQSTLHDEDVVLKVCNKDANVDKEFAILQHLRRHPNIIHAVAACEKLSSANFIGRDCLDVGIVISFHSGGSLEDLVKNHPEVLDDEVSLRQILLGVCRGVEALHEQNVVHRDIACRNFLVSANGRILLSDFGLSRKLEKGSDVVDESHLEYQYLFYEGGGLLPFRLVAPESLETSKFTKRSDIWAVGVLCIHLAWKCQRPSFASFKTPVALRMAFHDNPKLALLDLPEECPPILRRFVEKCCNMDKLLRPRIAKLVDLVRFTIFNEVSCKQTHAKIRNTGEHPQVYKPDELSSDLKEAGCGRFSWVFRTMLDKQVVALKVCKKADGVDVEKELEVLKHLGQHPNLLHLIGVCNDVALPSDTYGKYHDRGLVLPFYTGGSLKDFVKSHPDVIDDDMSLRNILIGVFRGVQALHNQKVIHRDIACRNFLVAAGGRIALSDFGFSRILEKNSEAIDESGEDYQYLFYEGHGVIPFRYTAPESLATMRFTMRSDIWSIGVMCIELSYKCQRMPFFEIKNAVALCLAFAKNPNLANEQLSEDCPRLLRQVVEKCCNVNMEARPKIQELIDWIYFTFANPEASSMMEWPTNITLPAPPRPRRTPIKVDTHTAPANPRLPKRTEAHPGNLVFPPSPVDSLARPPVASLVKLPPVPRLAWPPPSGSTRSWPPSSGSTRNLPPPQPQLPRSSSTGKWQPPRKPARPAPASPVVRSRPPTPHPVSQPGSICITPPSSPPFRPASPASSPQPRSSASSALFLQLKLNQNARRVKSEAEKFFDDLWKLSQVTNGIIINNPSSLIIDRARMLGNGYYGKVWRGTYVGTTVAVNEIVIRSNEAQYEQLIGTLKDYRQIKHPNLAMILGVNVDKREPDQVVQICVEYCHEGSLKALLGRGLELSSMWPLRARMAIEIATGLSFLHERNTLHYRLKPSTVLLTNDFRVKITGFGLVKIVHEMMTDSPVKYDCRYVAPEVTLGEPYEKSSDVYSFGIVLYEIFTLRRPYENINVSPAVFMAKLGQGMRPELPADMPKTHCDILKACWHPDKTKRSTAPEVIQMLRALPNVELEALEELWESD